MCFWSGMMCGETVEILSFFFEFPDDFQDTCTFFIKLKKMCVCVCRVDLRESKR